MKLRPRSPVRAKVQALRVWSIDLDRIDDGIVEQLRSTLSRSELIRASRFVFAEDRRRFVVCRGLLRRALARRLAIQPDTVEFSYGAWGKPAVRTTDGADATFFNVSRRGSLAVIALARDHAVGVDIERTDVGCDADAIARRYFSVEERCGIAASSAGERGLAFARCWTRREAVLKADGIGLSGLDISPEAYVRLERTYHLRTLVSARGHTASVALATMETRSRTSSDDARVPAARRY